MIRVCHLIPTLESGGAEHMLFRLVQALREQGICHASVVTLAEPGVLAERFRSVGIEVSSVRMHLGVPDPRGILRIAAVIRATRPDVLQTWMYHADLIGGIAGQLAGRVPVVWNIRHGNLAPGLNKRTTIWTANVCARASRMLPRQIVCCSEASRQSHISLGYEAERMLVIQNGIDVNRFKPDPTAGGSLRRELNLSPATPLVALVGRWNPQKDLGTFFEAAARIMRRIPNIRFALLGAGLDNANREMKRLMDDVTVADRCLLLGYREDVPRVLAAADVTVSSSRGEGFPNAVAEAMACGSLAVATDVGESALLVGGAGVVVPPQDPQALSEACLRLLLLGESERERLQFLARERIEQQFSLARASRHYGDLYQEVVRRHPTSRSAKCAA